MGLQACTTTTAGFCGVGDGAHHGVVGASQALCRLKHTYAVHIESSTHWASEMAQ